MISINKEYSIKKSQEIDSIIKHKNSVGNKFFVIYSMNNIEAKHYRYALSIGKKFGIAVKRNKMKRQIRNIIQQNINLLENKDYVFVIKPLSNTLSFEEIKDTIIYLLKKGAK